MQPIAALFALTIRGYHPPYRAPRRSHLSCVPSAVALATELREHACISFSPASANPLTQSPLGEMKTHSDP